MADGVEGKCDTCGKPGLYRYIFRCWECQDKIKGRKKTMKQQHCPCYTSGVMECCICLLKPGDVGNCREGNLNPDLVLKQIRKEAARLKLGNMSLEEYMETSASLADNFEDLDDWLSEEGYLPNAWYHRTKEEEREEEEGYEEEEGRMSWL